MLDRIALASVVVTLLGACGTAARRPLELPCDTASDGEMCLTETDGSARRMACGPDRTWRTIVDCAPGEICAYGVGLPAGASPVTACIAPNSTGIDAGSLDAGSLDDEGISTDAGSTTGDTAATMSGDGFAPKDATNDVKDTNAADASGSDLICLTTHCPSQAQQCLPVPSCAALYAKLVACVANCGGGQGCLTNCQGQAPDARAWQLAVCALLPCINPTLCGDGVCGSAESGANCPADCPAAPSGSCVGYCGGKSAQMCYCDPGCAKAKDCCADYVPVCGG